MSCEKSDHTRRIMLRLLFTRKGSWHSSYLIHILPYGKDQKPFFVAKVLSILGTKEIEAGFRFSLGNFPG